MEFKTEPYKVYAKLNTDNYIIAINSNEFLPDLTGWVYIDEGYGDKYHHAQGNYFPEPIITNIGAYRYKIVNSKAVECTEEELKAQEVAKYSEPMPTAQDDTDAMLVDHEYRLTLLELGVTE